MRTQRKTDSVIAGAFHTWIQQGRRFIAIPSGYGVGVMDVNGSNYGAWMTVDSFRRSCKKGVVSALGAARLVVHPINERG